MLNTDKLIAALTDAIEARKLGLPAANEENLQRYEECKQEVEHELKQFINAVTQQM